MWVCKKCKTENWNNDLSCKKCGTHKNAEVQEVAVQNVGVRGNTQGSYGNKVESWVCPACETVNTQDKCVVCGYQNEHKVDTIVSEKKKRLMLVLATAICLVTVIVLILFAKPKGPEIFVETEPEKAVSEPFASTPAADPTTDPITFTETRTLMASKRADETSPAFGGEYQRRQISSIIFLATTETAPKDSWDASQNQDGSVLAWVEPNGNLYDLFIGAEGGVLAPPNCCFLFAYFQNLSRIDFNENFDTTMVTDTQSMFRDCDNLTELNLSDFDTSKVKNMVDMFRDCNNLTKLNISGFDTANVKTMSCMFYNCNSLTELNVSGFNTTKVTNMGYMFYNCNSLTELNVSGFNTTKVTNMGGMFYGCSSLTKLDVSGFAVSKVSDYSCFMDSGRTINGQPWEEFFT